MPLTNLALHTHINREANKGLVQLVEVLGVTVVCDCENCILQQVMLEPVHIGVSPEKSMLSNRAFKRELTRKHNLAVSHKQGKESTM